MYELFDQNKNYTLPSGNVRLGKDLPENEYPSLFLKTSVIEIVDGVFVSYQTLSQLANTYGIEYSTDDEQDPQEVLDKVLEKKKLLEENPPLTISDTIKKAVMFYAATFTDAQALEVPDLYPAYELNHAYKKDERFTYNGRLFKVNQDHTSAAQWVPGETGTESLYTNLEMSGDGYLVWTQPTGAHNAYNTGDIVHYPTADDPLYKSLIDGNVWSPDAYPQGWEIYTEESSTETETPTEPSTDPSEDGGDTEASYPDFVQPTGAHDAYKLGDIVKFNGQLYKSKIDNNVYSPEAYPAGWELYTE